MLKSELNEKELKSHEKFEHIRQNLENENQAIELQILMLKHLKKSHRKIYRTPKSSGLLKKQKVEDKLNSIEPEDINTSKF